MMADPTLTPAMQARLLSAQRNEITEYHIYTRLADATKEPANAQVLRHIAAEERGHYNFWRGYTGQDVAPDMGKVRRFVLISRAFGLTFGIKLMERGEAQAEDNYTQIAKTIPDAARVVQEEYDHEHLLIDMINEERLEYMGAIVLGLNDALVELTGALSGLTFVLRNTRLIAVTGLITGIAAAFSMAGSEYLSSKHRESELEAGKASLYTGTAYIITVLLLILPYLIFQNVYLCLALMMLNALLIILLFTYYMSVAREMDFRQHFCEMAAISLGIAVLTFGIGYVIREAFGVEL